MKQWLAVIEFRLKKILPWLALAMIGQTILWFARFLLSGNDNHDYFLAFQETSPYLTIVGITAVIHMLTLLNPMAQRLRLLPLSPLQLYSAEFVSLLLVSLIGLSWIDFQYMYFGHYERSLTSSMLYLSFVIAFIVFSLLIRYLRYMWLRGIVIAGQFALLFGSIEIIKVTFLAIDEMKVFSSLLAIVTLINAVITFLHFKRAKGVWR